MMTQTKSGLNDLLINQYVKHGYKKVKGWLTPGAVSLITKINDAQKTLGIKGHVGEIGVHHGKLFVLLYLLAGSDENAVAVDLFEQQHLNDDRSGKGDLEILLSNLGTYAKDRTKLKLIKGDSTAIDATDVRSAAGGGLKLFSVDGGHTAQITCHDLMTACNSICDGGVIILDDYFNEEWPGVSEGTNRFFAVNKDSNLAPFVIGGDKVFFTNKAYADKYMDILRRQRIGWYFVRRELFGHQVLSYNVGSIPFKAKIRIMKHRFVLKVSKNAAWKQVRQTPLGRFTRKALGFNKQHSS